MTTTAVSLAPLLRWFDNYHAWQILVRTPAALVNRSTDSANAATSGDAEPPRRRCGHDVMSRGCSVTRRNEFVCDESLSKGTETTITSYHAPPIRAQACGEAPTV